MKLLVFITYLSLSSGQIFGQEGSVVGKLEHSLPAGNSIWVPPFVAEDTFAGRIVETLYNEGQDQTFISVNTTSLPLLENHYLEIGEGDEAGLALDIIASTGNGITIEGDASSLGLASSRVIIRQHLTLDSLLPDGANFAPFQDTFTIFLKDGSRLDLIWNPFASAWTDAFGTDFGDHKIRPGQGVLLFLSQELKINLGGDGAFTHVKTTPTRILAYEGAINLVGPVNPFPGTYPLAEIGFLADLAPFEDTASFFTTDGTFLPTQTYIGDGGLFSGGVSPIFLDGSGNDSSSDPIFNLEATVVNVLEDKTIGLSAPTITGITPLN